MNRQDVSSPAVTDRGLCVALLYALVAQRLFFYYEYQQELTKAQGATLAAEWLSRSRKDMPLAMRKHLSELSAQFVKQITSMLSRQTGLQICHEMQESLDPNYHTEIGESMMAECERFFDGRLSEER